MFVGSATSMPLSDSEFCLSPFLAINESPLLVICRSINFAMSLFVDWITQ